MKIPKTLNELSRLIGNTPLLAIHFRFLGRDQVIYAKLEQYNFTGSIKDRMAIHILDRAYQKGDISHGDTIIEASSGNTGISFTAIGRALGHPVRILLPDWLSRERSDLIRNLGGTVLPVSREQGGFVGSIRLADEMASREKNVFLPHQFSNEMN